MARNGLVVLVPTTRRSTQCSAAPRRHHCGVDYITYGQIAKGEEPAIITRRRGLWWRCGDLRQRDNCSRGGQRLGFHAVRRGSDSVAKTFPIQARGDSRAALGPGRLQMLAPDWNFVKDRLTSLGACKEIVEQIVKALNPGSGARGRAKFRGHGSTIRRRR
jgi:hypothetical protein